MYCHYVNLANTTASQALKPYMSLPAVFSQKCIVNTSQGSYLQRPIVLPSLWIPHLSLFYLSSCVLIYYRIDQLFLFLCQWKSHRDHVRTPLTITMELNGNQSIISALLGRGLVDAFSRSMALHVAHGAPFRGHNEHSVDKLGQLRLFLAKQLSTSPPSSLCLFTLHPYTNTRKLHRDDCKNILTSPYASCHCH